MSLALAALSGGPAWSQTVRIAIEAPTGKVGMPGWQASPLAAASGPLLLSPSLSPALSALPAPSAAAPAFPARPVAIEAARPLVAAPQDSFSALRATALPAASGDGKAADAARKSFDGQESPATRIGDGPALDAMTEDTFALVKMSKAYYKRHPKQEDAYDWIDQSIIPHIEAISKNPDFAVTGSCSGHDGGVPFICLVFKDAKARDAYLPLLLAITKAGKRKSKAVRLQFFQQHPEWKVKEEWLVAAPIEGQEFWKSVTGILARAVRR